MFCSKEDSKKMLLTVCVSLGYTYPRCLYLSKLFAPFRQVSTLRWAEILLQINSLVNPLLYWHRNRHLRKAALKLLRCRKPTRIGQSACTERIRQRRYSAALLDVEMFSRRGLKHPRRFIRSQSGGRL